MIEAAEAQQRFNEINTPEELLAEEYKSGVDIQQVYGEFAPPEHILRKLGDKKKKKHMFGGSSFSSCSSSDSTCLEKQKAAAIIVIAITCCCLCCLICLAPFIK